MAWPFEAEYCERPRERLRPSFTVYGHTADKEKSSFSQIYSAFLYRIRGSSIIADHLAEQVGVDVWWVPDYFNGVSHRRFLWCSGWLMSKSSPLRKAPADANSLEPLVLDRAGVKTRWLDVVKFILKIIPNLPRLFASLPSVFMPESTRQVTHHCRNFGP